MADNTKIEWADATVNAINGCSLASPGCTNCYAMRLAGTRMKTHPSRAGLTQDSKAGPVWTGEVRLNEKALLEPLRWRRPRRIFWNAHGDTFHDAVPNEWIDRIFAIAALTPQHTHMILTKRAKRMREYMSLASGRIADAAMALRRELGIKSAVAPLPHISPGLPWFPIANVWLGVSVEDQTRADERIPDLLATPAAVRFLSCEPLLGPVDIDMVPASHNAAGQPMWSLHGPLSHYCMRHFPATDCGCERQQPGIHWVIVGGESGPGARPMHPDWARSLRDQCAAAGVPFHFKQWGEYVMEDQSTDELAPPRIRTHFWGINNPGVYRVGKKVAGRLLDGAEHNEMPSHG